MAKPKCAKQTRVQGFLWGGTTSARQIDTLDGMARQGRRAPQVGGNLVYFVCFASQNAILSQPSADSSFHCAAVGGSAALRMRRPPCGEKGPCRLWAGRKLDPTPYARPYSRLRPSSQKWGCPGPRPGRCLPRRHTPDRPAYKGHSGRR